ncbi:hypothetical protein NVP1278O_03 [Vibrio phage 1.278.O._10N.286.54.E8]|nr:hypothetical protein NVP1278O_03 [Vibrio phage 1.278.O._10N.286.54.E8]
MKVLVACEESQAVCKEFRKLGHEAYSCDIDPCSGGHPEWHIQSDVLEVIHQGWDLMIAHPPCTRLTNAGARWLKIPPNGKTLVDMWRDLFEGAEFYRALRGAPIKMKCIENPIMHCHAKELVTPGHRQVVQPWWFGEEMFKATGFELIGLPDLVPSNKLTPPEKGTEEHKEWSWVHRLPPSPERARLRSKTPIGIAKAMAEQWGCLTDN